MFSCIIEMFNGDMGLKLNSKILADLQIFNGFKPFMLGNSMQFSMLLLSLVFGTELSFCNFSQKVQEMCDTGVVFFIAG